jgi:hypothetical protein
MGFTDLIDDHGKKIHAGHYRNLVQIAKVDGRVEKSELDLLHREGKKFGLTDSEIDNMIISEERHYYSPPYDLLEKFDELYNIASMILADNVITESEKSLIKRFAVAAGFSNESIDKLIPLLFEGIQKGEDEEVLFNQFKRRHLFE